MKKKHTKNQKEVRVRVAPQKFEVRKNADGSRSLSGWAATFGDLSEPLSGFREKIQRGAFKQSLKNNDVLCLYSHNDSQVLGRVSSGTLEIGEDSKGLKFTCKLPDTSTARDLIALLESGDLSQMSFGFSVNPDGDTWEQIRRGIHSYPYIGHTLRNFGRGYARIHVYQRQPAQRTKGNSRQAEGARLRR